LLTHLAVSRLVCKEYRKPNQPPVIDSAVVRFNGKGENGHETFYLPKTAHRACCTTGGIAQMDNGDSWGKPYDVAVCAVLISAKRHLGEKVSSDGNWDDAGWLRARALYTKVTYFISPPLWPVKLCVKCHRAFSKRGHNWGGYEFCHKCGGGGRHCYGKLGDVCMKCGEVNSFRKAHPTTWCWYCSSGYKGKADAGEAVAKRWKEVVTSLKRKHMRIV
jgi:hypothetical protein